MVKEVAEPEILHAVSAPPDPHAPNRKPASMPKMRHSVLIACPYAWSSASSVHATPMTADHGTEVLEVRSVLYGCVTVAYGGLPIATSACGVDSPARLCTRNCSYSAGVTAMSSKFICEW